MSSSPDQLVHISFTDVFPLKTTLLHITGLLNLAFLLPHSPRDLLEYDELFIFMLAWVYAYVSAAANRRMAVFTLLILLGWLFHGVYIWHRWGRCDSPDDLLFLNALAQAVVSCSAATYTLCLSWYRSWRGLPVVPELVRDGLLEDLPRRDFREKDGSGIC